ncbi:MAG: hypothetical protein M1434_14785 [Chloroflexi bacterium]|nr:hypothetical protein [Chloroflexota bacterium]MCL5275985.1 hypothetical protein [Chloroflexota bacterium]
MGALNTVVVSKEEYINYLDTLVESSWFNWQVWAEHLRGEFIELSKEEADKIVLNYLANYVEQQR